MQQQDLAADVLAQHATQAMIAHAADVATLRKQMKAVGDALGAAYAAIYALENKAQCRPSVPGYAEWRAKKEARA